MRKILLLLTASVLIVTLSSAAFAFGSGNNPASYDECPREMLDAEDQAKFESIITDFREKLEKVREDIMALRENGSHEEFRAKHYERYELMEEKLEALSDILPDDVATRFRGKGRELRHNGWDKNSGGFKAQSNSNR